MWISSSNWKQIQFILALLLCLLGLGLPKSNADDSLANNLTISNIISTTMMTYISQTETTTVPTTAVPTTSTNSSSTIAPTTTTNSNSPRAPTTKPARKKKKRKRRTTTTTWRPDIPRNGRAFMLTTSRARLFRKRLTTEKHRGNIRKCKPNMRATRVRLCLNYNKKDCFNFVSADHCINLPGVAYRSGRALGNHYCTGFADFGCQFPKAFLINQQGFKKFPMNVTSVMCPCIHRVFKKEIM